MNGCNREIHPKAIALSTAAAKAPQSDAPTAAADDGDAVMLPADTPSTDSPAAAAALKPADETETVTARFRALRIDVSPHAVIPAAGDSVLSFSVDLPNDQGDREKLTLWVPRDRVDDWWVVSQHEPLAGSTVTLRDDIDTADSVMFPIFMPSCGRAATALLDLSRAIPMLRYNQIVVVKHKEADAYRRGRPHLMFLVLPPSADDLGVGASRYWIMECAKHLLRGHSRPFVFVMDDNVLFWRGTISCLHLSSCAQSCRGPTKLHIFILLRSLCVCFSSCVAIALRVHSCFV